MPLFSVEVNGKSFDVFSLPSYNTAYYYVKEYGSVNHFDTVRKLTNYISRRMAGKKR